MHKKKITFDDVKKSSQIMLNNLYKSCLSKEPDYKSILQTAFTLGMAYRETQIKEGIDIVFNELHKKE
jgi:hypothetical protein